MLEGAFGNNMMAERTVRRWHKLFIDGRISPENEKKNRSSTGNNIDLGIFRQKNFCWHFVL